MERFRPVLKSVCTSKQQGDPQAVSTMSPLFAKLTILLKSMNIKLITKTHTSG